MFSVTKSVTGRHQISDETGGFDHLDVTKTVTSLIYHLGGGSFPSLSTAENHKDVILTGHFTTWHLQEDGSEHRDPHRELKDDDASSR